MMSVEQFIDVLYGYSYWLIAAGFVVVALYSIYTSIVKEE